MLGLTKPYGPVRANRKNSNIIKSALVYGWISFGNLFIKAGKKSIHLRHFKKGGIPVNPPATTQLIIRSKEEGSCAGNPKKV
jgi:hypothetical protein